MKIKLTASSIRLSFSVHSALWHLVQVAVFKLQLELFIVAIGQFMANAPENFIIIKIQSRPLT